MSTLTIEAKASVLPPPVTDETQKRFENEIVGTPGQAFTESNQGLSGDGEIEHTMGFQPPAERRRMDALLAELHTFLNPERPGKVISTDGEPQGA